MNTLRIWLLGFALLGAACGDDTATAGTTGGTGGGAGTGGSGGQGNQGGAGGSGGHGGEGQGGMASTGSGGSGGAASDVGQPCTSDDDCQFDCLLNYPGGYCTMRDCSIDPGGEPQCPAGSTCKGGGGIGSYACFDECVTGDDCRQGYVCCSADGDLVCAPENFLCG